MRERRRLPDFFHGGRGLIGGRGRLRGGGRHLRRDGEQSGRGFRDTGDGGSELAADPAAESNRRRAVQRHRDGREDGYDDQEHARPALQRVQHALKPGVRQDTALLCRLDEVRTPGTGPNHGADADTRHCKRQHHRPGHRSSDTPPYRHLRPSLSSSRPVSLPVTRCVRYFVYSSTSPEFPQEAARITRRGRRDGRRGRDGKTGAARWRR